MTFTLATLTFFLIHFNSIKACGLKHYAKEYIEPLPFLLPINILEQFTLPLSMCFRLFGNLTGGVIIMGLVYEALMHNPYLGFGLIIPIPLHAYFDGFIACLQSFVFTMLTMVFVAKGMDHAKTTGH
jgi:F-type H+-transporting ATPase subunit a